MKSNVDSPKLYLAILLLYFTQGTPLLAQEITTYSFPKHQYTFRTEKGKLWVNDEFIAQKTSWGTPAFARDGAVWYIRSQEENIISWLINGPRTLGNFFSAFTSWGGDMAQSTARGYTPLDPGTVQGWFNGREEWYTPFRFDRITKSEDLAFWEKTPEGLYYCQEFLRLGPYKDKRQFTDLFPNYQKDREFFVTGNRYAYLFDNEQGHYLNYGGQILGPFKAEPDVFLGPNGLDAYYIYPLGLRGLKFPLELNLGSHDCIHRDGKHWFIYFKDPATGIYTLCADGKVIKNLPGFSYPRVSEDGRSFTLFLKDKDYTWEFDPPKE